MLPEKKIGQKRYLIYCTFDRWPDDDVIESHGWPLYDFMRWKGLEHNSVEHFLSLRNLKNKIYQPEKKVGQKRKVANFWP